MDNGITVAKVSDAEIAIIGLGGRFPGARSVAEFWENIKGGVESISFFSDEELRAAGVPDDLLNDPDYVKARAILKDVELFDAAFFGYSPREAEILDPQQRLFLECAWEALEDAGYTAAKYKGRIGVYGGTSLNAYLLNLYSNRRLMDTINPLQLLVLSDKDFLTTRVSYKLNFTGPSIAVQTACSTSLVAVHLACQSLLNGECDMALAGGVSIRIPQKAGYLYHEGSILSPDGHCRAFDADSKGTVSGDGVGVIVLKRLEDALADGDAVRAVIKGSAVNNDGMLKVGYTAPSGTAQAAVIAEAQAIAGIEVDSIGYIEAHGTGTTMGDPIEIAALTDAFRTHTRRKGFCAIGSVKTNIGHLDAAAGVAGLIKVVLALQAKQLPPSLNFKRPNPRADFPNSPFQVNTELKEWSRGDTPRRAGVSSFGLGGTNAHVVLEEAPPLEASGQARPYQLLLISAKTETAVTRAKANLAAFLRENPSVNLADVAYTLQVGREDFPHRSMTVCHSLADAIAALDADESERSPGSFHDASDLPVIFMFSGQGSQYVNMAAELYRSERAFRERIDHCADYLRPQLGFDLRDALYPPEAQLEEAKARLDQTHITQPALFAVEYALAGLWHEWGVRPGAMIGHSIGEYVAACLAGVFSLEDALTLVSARGRLMQELPPGAMMAVELPEAKLQALLNGGVSLAAVNAPNQCVVSGPFEAIEEFQRRLSEQAINHHRLHTSHAFHSEMMDSMTERFAQEVKSVKLNPPNLPYISGVTGDWIRADEATSPDYWAGQARATVQFQAGLKRLLQSVAGALLEVGPGNTLSGLARRQIGNAGEQIILSSLRHAKSPQSDIAFLLDTLGKLWLAGVTIDWPGFYEAERRRRLPLPTYPFERQRYWVEAQPEMAQAVGQRATENESLPQAAHPRPKLGNAYVAPRTELERVLAEIWQRLLGTEQIGVHDDFFSLGGHSLLATQLASDLRETYEIDLPLHKIFEASTVAKLAFLIEEMLIEQVEKVSDEEAQEFLRMQSQAD